MEWTVWRYNSQVKKKRAFGWNKEQQTDTGSERNIATITFFTFVTTTLSIGGGRFNQLINCRTYFLFNTLCLNFAFASPLNTVLARYWCLYCCCLSSSPPPWIRMLISCEMFPGFETLLWKKSHDDDVRIKIGFHWTNKEISFQTIWQVPCHFD